MKKHFASVSCGMLAALLSSLMLPHAVYAELRAGAAIVDVTPVQFPVLVNGGMLSRTADTVKTRLNARAVVLDDGSERLAIVVVDSCMMPRPLLDDAKQLAAQRTKIKPDRMLISATHTHSAPSSLSCLGTEADPTYIPYLREKLAEAIARAEANLQPAQVGWGLGDAAEFTALRRWIRRPDRLADDPFGNPTVRANMHAGRNWDDVTGESGPEDPDLSMIAFRSNDGQPIAVLANFSMHYFGDQALSADYFGLFCDGFQQRINQPGTERPFVALLSHGCSGDIWRRDYKIPAEQQGNGPTIESYVDGLLNVALEAFEDIEYRQDADLAMAETRMELKYRVPDKQRLEWAERVVKEMGDRLPKSQTEVYAREQIILHQRQSTEVVVQAIRIGDLAIATTPNETYALTGLKLKLQSPLTKTMVIELANGGDGYIPPPEQHLLGGYNTWPARSAGLEVTAEPKIAAAALGLLETVAGQARRHYVQSRGPAAEQILRHEPAAYWRLDEFAGPRAVDSSGRGCDAIYEPAVAYFLAGPHSGDFCRETETNRCVHFAGDRLQARLASLGENYSVSAWFWNGMPNDARGTSGWIFSRDHDHGLSPAGDHLGVSGKDKEPGRLIFVHGNEKSGGQVAVGHTVIDRWTWNHVLFVRAGDTVQVYLNGNPSPEIEVRSKAAFPPVFEQIFFGGRSNNKANWEGRLDEVAVFNRALSAKEAAELAEAESP